MDKFLKSVCYFLVCLLMAVSPVMNAADPIFMGGQYHFQDSGRKLFGKFATVDHKGVGYEECTMANTK